MPDRFYITTPIYYVNDVPHIGHAYTTILADVLARYHRLLGQDTYFLTGTDEHGQKVNDAAIKAGISPQEQADRTVVRFIDAWKQLGISNDDFIRTTDPRHTRIVQATLADLHEKGEIYRGDYEGWYSVSEERFYAERELVEGKSPEGKPVERVVETNYFFRMSRYQQWLIDYIGEHPGFIQPTVRRNETLGFLKKPLGDLCISRPKSRLPWGIELPWDRDYVCYVWFDALLNYISGVGYRSDDALFERWWPASLHLIGKDILTTHTVYWPTMLQAMGVPQPACIFAHGWWLKEGEKMSKSVGNVTDPMDMIDAHGVDAVRYYLMADMTLGQDALFTETAFVQRYNADLANDLGNLASRVLTMIARQFEGRMPPAGRMGEDEAALRDDVLNAAEEMEGHVTGMTLDRGLSRVIDAVRSANRYFDKKAPWALAKAGKREELGTVLAASAEALRVLSGLLDPVIPAKMAELRAMLGMADATPAYWSLKEWGALEAGTPLGDVHPLFPRIEVEKGKPSRAKEEETEPEGVALIDIDTFFKSQLRVARVETVERVPKADRLLRLTVSLGGESRQIVAGIAEHYEPDALVGKLVVVVANLRPAKIRGIESRGMLLAAKEKGRLRVVTIDGDVAPGAEVG